MSYSLRDGENANSAILCTVETSDFPSDSPLAGIELQEEYEKYAFAKNNSYNTTVQLVGDFLHGVPSKKVWSRYLEWQEKREKGKIVKVDFRNKKK